MADRKKLHALVDSLPEGALESAQTYLKAIQTWPPKPPNKDLNCRSSGENWSRSGRNSLEAAVLVHGL